MRAATPWMLLGCALLLSAGTARASPEDAATAETLFRDGRSRVEAGDYARACSLFAESLRLDYALGTLLNLAACEERVGRLLLAWEHYAELLDRLPGGDERRGLVLERRAALDRVVPLLTVVLAAGAPGDTRVMRDATELRGASLAVPLPVEVGAHTIVVDAPGRAARRWEVRLAAGERRTMLVAPGEPLTAPQEPAAQPVEHASALRTVAWVVGGAGVASLAVGTTFGIMALNKRSDSDAVCSGDTCRSPGGPQAYEDAKSFALVADVTLGLGLVAVATAGTLLFSTAASEPRDSPRVSLHLTPFGLGGTF